MAAFKTLQFLPEIFRTDTNRKFLSSTVDQMIQPGVVEKINSFVETIEIIRNLDLVISVDTSIAHLTAGLGVKLYLLLEYSPFWYWNIFESENYYQNSQITFFNQKVPGDWFSVINNLKNKLIN